jgi:glycosyltransferase involved in cell wall biosynthesis
MAAIDRIATGVFVNCEAIATHLNVDWKLNRSRIHVCHNGYEPEEFHSRGRSRPAALADASIVIGTVALLRPEKNLGLLIQAFARVYRLDKQARLLIVGSGPMKAELLRLTADLQIAGACIFQEAVTEPAAWMRAIDVFVLPSLSEGFSNSLLEAMACGCCPVASRVGGTPELVRDGDCGILFESGGVAQLADSLIFLARNQVERERLASSATAYVRSNCTIQRASARLADIYWELLGESKENGYDTMRSETAGERQNKFSSASAGIDLAAQRHRC